MTESNQKYCYNGSWLEDLYSGQGNLIDKNGEYFGEFKKGKRDGLGYQHQICKGGVDVYYQGEWKNDLRDGKSFSLIDYPNCGRVRRDGIWKKGLEHGEFTIIHEG